MGVSKIMWLAWLEGESWQEWHNVDLFTGNSREFLRDLLFLFVDELFGLKGVDFGLQECVSL